MALSKLKYPKILLYMHKIKMVIWYTISKVCQRTPECLQILFSSCPITSSAVWLRFKGHIEFFGFELLCAILASSLSSGIHPVYWQVFLSNLSSVLGAGYVWYHPAFQWRSYSEEESGKAKITRAGGREEKGKEERRGSSWKVSRLIFNNDEVFPFFGLIHVGE